MATLETAIAIAARAHEGVKDKQGDPYILHSLAVMSGVDTDEARQVAVLHDVVEDTDTTFEDLERQGVSKSVLNALKLVTHRKDDSYADYVIAINSDPVAKAVKLSDLRHNAGITRVLLRAEKFAADSDRLHRYILSYHFLTDQISESDYRRLMSEFES